MIDCCFVLVSCDCWWLLLIDWICILSVLSRCFRHLVLFGWCCAVLFLFVCLLCFVGVFVNSRCLLLLVIVYFTINLFDLLVLNVLLLLGLFINCCFVLLKLDCFGLLIGVLFVCCGFDACPFCWRVLCLGVCFGVDLRLQLVYLLWFDLRVLRFRLMVVGLYSC